MYTSILVFTNLCYQDFDVGIMQSKCIAFVFCGLDCKNLFFMKSSLSQKCEGFNLQKLEQAILKN